MPKIESSYAPTLVVRDPRKAKDSIGAISGKPMKIVHVGAGLGQLYQAPAVQVFRPKRPPSLIALQTHLSYATRAVVQHGWTAQ